MPKLRLLMPKVVATTPAEALRRLLAMMAAREWSAREEMPAAVVGPPTEPRRPKTKPRGALLTLQLARCEGRGRVTVNFCVVIMIFLETNTFGACAGPYVGPCAGDRRRATSLAEAREFLCRWCVLGEVPYSLPFSFI